jgi:hypothetical protein
VADRTDYTITLKWSEPSSNGSPIYAYGINWERLDEDTNLYVVEEAVAVFDTEITLTRASHGIKSDSFYRFSVEAANTIGSGSRSAKVSARTDQEYSVPSAPRNLREDSQSGTHVTVSFRAPSSDGGSEVTLYKVYVEERRSSSGDYFFVDSVESEETTVVVENLALQSTYRMTVSAFNRVGESEQSDEIIVNTERATVPEAPLDVSVSIEQAGITVSWSAPFNGGATLTGYSVVFQTADGSFVASDNCQPGLQTSCSFNANTLKAAPWNLNEEDKVIVEVSASNA